MMSNDYSRRISIACATFLAFILIGGSAWAISPIKSNFDLIPQLQPVSKPVIASKLEADIRISPVFGGELPVPQLPKKAPMTAMTPANRKAPLLGVGGLPFPILHFGPALLTPARNVQVGAAGSKVKVSSNTAIAVVVPAKPVPTAAPLVVEATAKPSATAKPKIAANPTVNGVKAPVPLQRSTQPAMVAVATATPRPASTRATAVASAISRPASTATPLIPANDTNNVIFNDPNALPEYNLVQLPAQSPPPLPADSLLAKSQDLDGLQGQALSIRLAGRGWIYTGTGKTPGGVSYIEKSVQNDSEQFRFRLDEIGRLVLQFQRQDVASGLLDREDVSVTVKSRVQVNNNNGMRVQANSMDKAGIGAYQPEFPVPQDSANQKRPVTATPKPSREVATVIPVAAKNPENDFNPADLPGDAAGLYSLAVQREQIRQNTNARLCYEKILKDFPAFEKTADTMFHLAKLLENAAEGKDIRRAYELYVRIQNEYPYSSWVEQSKDRSRFIKRTFFQQ